MKHLNELETIGQQLHAVKTTHQNQPPLTVDHAEVNELCHILARILRRVVIAE